MLRYYCRAGATKAGSYSAHWTLAASPSVPVLRETTPDRRDEGARVPPRRGAGGPPRRPGGGRLLGAGAVRRDAAEPVRERVRREGVPDGRLLRQAQVPRVHLPVPVQGRRQPEAPRGHQAQAEGVHRLQGARAQLLASSPRRARARRRESLRYAVAVENVSAGCGQNR